MQYRFAALRGSNQRGADPVLQNKAEIIDRPEIKVVASKGGTLAFLSGPVNMDSSPEVRDQLLVIVRTANPKIVSIDLSGVTQFDSSGLATLIDALRTARSSKTQLTLWGLDGRLLHLFELTGILSLFNVDTEVNRAGYQAI
jgi:anti-anti-sigma factor